MDTLKWLLVLLAGVTVGALLPYVFDERKDPGKTVVRTSGRDVTPPTFNITPDTSRDDLLARIAELEALLRNRPAQKRYDPHPEDTPQLLVKLLEEAYADNNVDWLIDVIRRLLAMGEDGYPILRRMIEDIAFKGKFLPSGSDFRVDQLYSVGKVFADQEKEFIGFLNFMLVDPRTIPIMRQFTMMGAAYYVGSKADGSEELQQTLIKLFLEQGGMGEGLIPGMPARASEKMQIFAMAMSGDKEAVGPLRDKLNSTKDKDLQGDIIGALAYLGDESTVPLIRDRLDPQTGDFRREIDALGRVGTEEAHATAAEFLRSIPDSKRFYRHTRRYMRAGGGTAAVVMMRERIAANPNDPEIANTIGSLRRFPTKESRETLAVIRDTTGNKKVQKRASEAVDEIDRKLRGELPPGLLKPQ